MSHNSLYPAHVEIEYSSAYAPHVMTLPTVPINQNLDGSWEFVLRGAALPVIWTDAIDDYIAIIKTYFTSSVTFQNATLYQWDDVEGPPNPVAGYAIGVNGTGTATTGVEQKATQRTFTWRTDEFGIFKIVFLDTLGTNYERVTDPANASVADLHDYVTADVTFLAGRDGGRPNFFLQMSTTLNRKLRKAYRMV